MKICTLCKQEKEHVEKQGSIQICDSCSLDIASAFSYHIGNKEVTKDEYDRTLDQGYIDEKSLQ